MNDSANFTINSTGHLFAAVNLSFGPYYLNVSVADLFGNTAWVLMFVNFTDTTDPIITEIHNVSSEYPTEFLLDINATDNYQLDSGSWAVNDTNFNITGGDLLNNTGIAVGVYFLNVSINDTSGNNGYALLWVNVTDTTSPTITEYVNLSTEYPTQFLLDINATDNYQLDSASWAVNDTDFSIGTSGNLTNSTGLAVGVYYLDISVNDTSGNSVSQKILVNVTDTTAPNVFLTSPANATNTTNTNNITITVTATDNYNLASCTLYTDVWGSYESNGTLSFSGTSDSDSWSLYNVSNGTYLWDAYCCDSLGNCAWNGSNFSLLVYYTPREYDLTAPEVNLSYPPDNFNTTSTSAVFNCSVTDTLNVTNVTLYGNWSGAWHANETNSSALNNHNYTFSNTLSDGNYAWNCYACDNASNCAYAAANRTITIDSTAPEIDAANITVEVYNNFSIMFNATDSGIGLNTGSWTVNDSANFTINSTGHLFAAVNLSFGPNYLNVTVEDLLGNMEWVLLWVNFTDTTDPIITEIHNVSSEYPTEFLLDINATDNYQLDSGSWAVNDTNFNITGGDLLNNTGIAVGVYFLNVSINDTSGNNGYALLWVNVTDTTSPTITEYVNLSTEYPTQFLLDINATDNYQLDSASWAVNDTDFSIGTSGNLTNSTGLAVGVYYLDISVNDTSGNSVSQKILVNVTDTTAPNVFLTSPANATNTTNTNNITITVTATDNYNLASCTLYTDVWGSYESNGTLSFSGTSDSDSWSLYNVSNGTYLWDAYCCDSLGNCAWNGSNFSLLVYYTPREYDLTAPEVNLSYPPDNFNTTSTSAVFNCSVTDTLNVTNVTLYGNWSGAWHANETNSSALNNHNYTFSNTLSDGNYAWNCYACDNASNCAYAAANRTITIDSTAPEIDAANITAEVYNNFSIEFNATDSGVGLNTSSWSVNDTANFTFNSSGWLSNVVDLAFGVHYLEVSVVDLQGNNASDNIWVNVTDTTIPSITLIGPSDGQVFAYTNNITLNLSATDNYDLDSCVVRSNVTGEWTSNKTINFNGTSDSSNNWVWKNLDNGTIYWDAYCCDSNGNCNTSGNYSFTISPTTDDNNPPVVSLMSPVDTYNSSSSSVVFNCSVYDLVNVTNVTLYGNWSGAGHANETNSSGQNNSNYIFTKTISDGYYEWNCYACDNSTNCANSTSRTFTLDSTSPVINNYSDIQVEFPETIFQDINATDNMMLDTSSWSVNDSLFSINSDGHLTNNTGLSLGVYYIDVSVNDTLDNVDTQGIIIYVSDIISPNVVISSPANGTNYTNTNNITITISATDNWDLSSCTLYTDAWGTYSSDGSKSFSNVSGSDSWYLYNVSNGTYTFDAYCCDDMGNCAWNASNNTYFHVSYDLFRDDSAPPSIDLQSPSNNSVSTSASVDMSCLVSDGVEVDNVTLWSNISGTYAPNGTNSSGPNAFNYSFSRTFSDGSYIWSCYACDNSSNCGYASENRSLIVDSNGPTISSVSISDDYVATNQTVTVTVNASDTMTAVSTVTAEGTVLTYQGDDLFSGPVVLSSPPINVSANDSYGNINTDSSVSYIVDDTNPAVNSITLSDNYTRPGQIVIITVNVTDNRVASVTADGVSLSNSSSQPNLWLGNISFSSGSNVTVIATDAAGNTNTSEGGYHTYDDTFPLFYVFKPIQGMNYTGKNISFNFTISEANLSYYNISLDYGRRNYSSSVGGNSTRTYIINFTDLRPGKHRASFRATDEAGNTKSIVINFTMLTPLNVTDYLNHLNSSFVESGSGNSVRDITFYGNNSNISNDDSFSLNNTNVSIRIRMDASGVNTDVEIPDFDGNEANWEQTFSVELNNQSSEANRTRNRSGASVRRYVLLRNMSSFIPRGQFRRGARINISYTLLPGLQVIFINDDLGDEIYVLEDCSSNSSFGYPPYNETITVTNACYWNHSTNIVTLFIPHFSGGGIVEDNLAPVLSIDTPEVNNSNLSSSSLNLGFTVSELNPADGWFCNYSFSVNGSSDIESDSLTSGEMNPGSGESVYSYTSLIENLVSGAYNFNVTCRDNNSQVSKKDYNLTINDTAAPVITAGPSGTQSTSQTSLNVNIYATTDENAKCWYGTDNVTFGTTMGSGSWATSHTDSKSYTSDDTSETYYVKCTDPSDNSAYTTISYTVNVAEDDDDDDDDDGGSSSSSSSSSPPASEPTEVALSVKSTKVIEPATADEDITITFTGALMPIPIEEISIDLNSDLESSTILRFERLSSEDAPTNPLPQDNLAYHYVEVNPSSFSIPLSNIDEITMQFRIENGWVANESINESTIGIYKLINTEWVEQEVISRDSDSSYNYIRIRTEGFSIFGIFAKESDYVALEPTPSPTPSTPEPTTTPSPTPDDMITGDVVKPTPDESPTPAESPSEQDVGPGYFMTIIYFIIIILCFVTLIVWGVKKGIHQRLIKYIREFNLEERRLKKQLKKAQKDVSESENKDVKDVSSYAKEATDAKFEKEKERIKDLEKEFKLLSVQEDEEEKLPFEIKSSKKINEINKHIVDKLRKGEALENIQNDLLEQHFSIYDIEYSFSNITKLLEYINTQIEAGHDIDDVKKIILKSNWDKNLVDDLVSILTG